MMTREHHRRRSPESERRRRKSRRDSRELLEHQQMPVPAPYDIRNTEIITTRSRKPSSSNSDSDLSLSMSSSSTTSSLINISRKDNWGFGSFFSSTSSKQRQNKVRKKRAKKRFFRFGNSSSSSTNSDLAYGKGYIDREGRRSRDFTPPGRQDRPYRDGLEGQRPLPPKREQTDEEIMELGRKFAEMARLQNNEDLRAAGRHRPSALVGAAAAISQFHRTNSGHRLDRGHGSSKPSHKSSEDEDSEWESASEDEEESSEDDSGLVYGSNASLPTEPQQPVQKNKQSELSIPPELERPLQRKPSIVDPRLFGPVNSLRGIVQTPCGFDKVDRSSVEDTRGLPVAASETVSFEGRPLQEVYPMPIPDSSRYDAGRGSIVSAIQESGRSRQDSRPAPVPIQQPKPIVPVSSKLYNTTEPDARDYRDSQRTSSTQRTSSGKGIAGVAAATIAGAALAGALANEHKEELDRKEERDRRREARREERRREERRVEDHVDHEREEKLQEERRRELLAEQEREEKRREERRREERLEQEREEKRRSKQAETNSRSEKSEKRRSKDDRKDDRSDKHREKKSSEADRDNNRERRRRERHRDDASIYERERERERSDRPNDERRDREGKPDSKDALKDEIREGKRASRPTDLDSYRRVADDAFQTPKNATTPNRPLTPNVVFVEREPDFSKFELTEADTKPRERLSRRETFERELEHAKEVYKEAKHATAPIEPAGMAAAMAAVEEERRGRNPRRGGDSTSRTRSRHDTPPRDAILEAADRYYRQQVIAQQIVQDHVREATPERSVVDKWQEEPEIEIVAPPEQDEKPKTKSPYEPPNADVRIDNVLSPKEIVQPDGRSRKPRLVRDPSAERGRPMLNIVRPTPDPSPMTQERKLESETTKEAKEAPQTSSRAAPDVVIGPRGDVVQAPAMPSKAVSWGENETKHYVLEDPVRDRSSDSDKKVVVPAETPKPRLSRKGKSGGWDILAAAVAPAVASTISDSAIDVTEPESKRSKDPPKGKQREPFSFEEFGDEPPAIGPKPSGPRSKQMPGSFADDLDFTATVAAGLQDSGFDPNLVIDNAGYHQRQSPPGSNEPGNYRTPFAETVPDLGVYAVPAVDPVAAEQRGFVIGELPETPAAEKDIPAGKSDSYSQMDKKERNGEEKASKPSKYDRSEIVVIEDEPTKSSRSINEDTSSSQSPILSKKEQKRQDKAAKIKAMEEEELGSTVSSLKESELGDSSSKKSKKSKKAVVVHEEAAPATKADPRKPTIRLVNDEWDVPQKDKRSRRGSDPPSRSGILSERAIHERESKQMDERPLLTKRDTIATDTLARSERASEARETPRRRRTVDEFSSFELTEEPEDWDLSKESKKPKPELSKYDSASQAPSVADNIVGSPKELPSSFSDLHDLKGSAPDEESGTPKKSKKKKSKRDLDLYDTPLGSPTMSRSFAPSETSPDSQRHRSKRESRASSLPRSAAPSEGPSESPRHRSTRESRASSLTRSELADEKSERHKLQLKRRSTAGGIPGEGEPPDRGRRKEESFQFIENDSRSVMSDPAGFFDHHSAPTKKNSKDKSKSEKEKLKEKRSSPGSGFFDRFKSSMGIPDEKERSRKSEEEKKNSFLDNAGTLGAGVGLAAAAEVFASQTTGQKATDLPSEKEAHSIPFTPERRSNSPKGLDFVDPEIVQREIRPAIDPQYGDFLPLPPSAPGSPPPEVTELPALPDSRPETPEHERQLLREIMEKPTHARRRSAHETPVKLKTPSQSAIPIQFRLGQRGSPVSPKARRQQSPLPSPETLGPANAFTPPRTRAPRPMSWDSSKQLKPLSLLLRTARESGSSPDRPNFDLIPSPSSSQTASGSESHGPEHSNRLTERSPFTGLEALRAIRKAVNTPLPAAAEDELVTESESAALQAVKAAISTPLPPVTDDELNTKLNPKPDVKSDTKPDIKSGVKPELKPDVKTEAPGEAIAKSLPPATKDELNRQRSPFTGFKALQAIRKAINTPLPPASEGELITESESALQAVKTAINTPLPIATDDEFNTKPEVKSEVLPKASSVEAVARSLPSATDDKLNTESESAIQAVKVAIITPLPVATDDEFNTKSEVKPEVLPKASDEAVVRSLPSATDDKLNTESESAIQAVKFAISTPLPVATDDELNTKSEGKPEVLPKASDEEIAKPLPPIVNDGPDAEVNSTLHTIKAAINTPLPNTSDDELIAKPEVLPKVLPKASGEAIAKPLPPIADNGPDAKADSAPQAVEDTPSTPPASTTPPAGRWGFNTASNMRLPARHMMNVWQAMRGGLNRGSFDSKVNIQPQVLPQTSGVAINTLLPAATDNELDIEEDSASHVVEDATNRSLPVSSDDKLTPNLDHLPRDNKDAINTPLPATADDELNAHTTSLPEPTLQESALPYDAKLERAADQDDKTVTTPEPVDTMTKNRSSYLLHSSPPAAGKDATSEVTEQSLTGISLSKPQEPADIVDQSSEAVVMNDSAVGGLAGAATGVAIATTLLHDNDNQARSGQNNISESSTNDVSAETKAKEPESIEQPQQPEVPAQLDTPAEASISSPKKSKKKKKGKKNASLEPVVLPSPIVEDAPLVEEAPMQAQEDTSRGGLDVEGTSTEIAQPAIETQADDTEAQNANKDQPAGDEHESRVVAKAPLVGTESTVMKAPPVTEAQPVDDGAEIANKDRSSGDEIWSIDESQPVGSEPPSVEAQSTIEAQLAAKALPVIEEEPVSESQPATDILPPVVEAEPVLETQSQNDTAIVTTPKKNKKKKNRKSVTFDVGSETLAEPDQAGPSMNESETTSALVPEDKSTVQSEVVPPFETPAEDHERRADLEPVPVLVAAHDQQTTVPVEGANIDNEISASAEPDAGLASNNRHDPLLASLDDEDEKCIGQTEELPLISDTQVVPSTSQSTLQQSEPQPVPGPAEIEPSPSSPSKKAKKKSRKSLALEPEASREIPGPETQTPIINEPITTLEENVSAKTVGRDILTPDFVDALSTPPVHSTQTKSSEQDILTPDFVDAPSSLPMDTLMADNAVQDSTVQVAPVEAPMSKDTEVTIPPMSTEEEKPTEKEIEFTSAAEATTPIIEDKPKEEEVQLTPTVSNPPSPVSKKSKKKKAKKSSASQPEESISTSTQDTSDLSTYLPASASATDNAIEPSLTVPSQPETSVLDGLNATEEKQSNEALADIGAEPVIVEPQTAQEQALPDEPIVQSLTREAQKAAEQGLPDQATVQPPTEEPQSSTQTSVPDELVPTSPTSTKSKKKKKGKKTQSVDTVPQDLAPIIPQNETEVARPTTPTEESAGAALEDKVDQQTQEPSTLKLQPTEIMDNTPAGDHFQEQTTINSQPMQVDVAEKVPVDQEPQEQDTTELQPTQVEAVEKELADQHLQEQTAVESQPVIGENSVGETASESVVPIKKSKKKKNKKSQSTIEPTSDSLVPSINEPLQDVTVADAPNQPQPDETSRSAALPSADVPKPDDARPAESVPLGESFPVTTVPTSATHQSAPEPDYLPSAPAVYVRPMDSVGAPREEIYFPSALSMLPAASALQGHRYPAQAQAETKSSEQQGPPSELEGLEEGKNVPEEPHGWAEDSDRRGEPGELGTETLRTTPAPVHATTGFDGPDLSQGKSTEPTVAEEVEGAPAQARTQPDLFSGEEELQRDPGRLGLADPPPDPLPSVDPAGLVRDAGDLPAQPPMAVGENDAPAGDITDPSITPSTQDGPKNSIDISDGKEDSGGSKKGKKNKKKKRQSATESLDPQLEAPSRAIEPVEEPLSQTSPSVEHPIEPEPIAVTQEPSSSIEDQPVERLDSVDADGAASMAKKAKKSQKDSQVLDDLGETAPSVEEPMTESAKDDAVTTQEDAASESTAAPMTGADEAQPEEEWAPVKKSKKDKKKNKSSSVPLDTEVPSEPTTIAEDPMLEPAASTEPPVNVDDQATKDEASSKEVVADDEWAAIPPKKSKKKKARTSLSDEGEDKSADVAAEPTPGDASEQVSDPVPEPALEPTPEVEVPPPSEEVVKTEDDVDAAPATPKKSKKDKKKRKSVAFADSAEEQPMGSLEKAQDDVASSDPTDEPVPADSEVKPEPAVLSDVPTGKSSSSGPLENKDDQARSVPSSEPLEVPNSEPDESTSQATIDRDVSGVSPDEEFTAVTKKSKKDKKKAKKKSQEQELDATAPEMPAALDETASTTGQHTEIHRDIGNSSAVTQDETTPEQAIAETTVLDEPKQVKAESIVEVPSERPQSPSAEPEAVDKQSTDTRDLPSQDSSNIEQSIGHSTDTPAEQPEEQPVQTHDDEFTVVPTKKSKKDKKKKKSSQAQLQDSSSVETPTEQQSFLAPGQPSEKEPSATEPWVTEDIAGPSEEQPVEEHNDQDGTIVADKSTLKAGLETSEVAHEASSTLAEPASVGSNITTVPELQAASEGQSKEDTLQQDRDLPEQTNTLDAVAEDEWGISSPAKSKKDKKKKKKGAELTSEEQLIEPIEEASAPSPLVDAPVEASLLERATPDQVLAPSLEDKSGAGPSEELFVSDRPEPEVVSPKKSKKDKKKKKQTSSWEDELGELPTPAENEPAALPSDTAPQQVDEVVVAEASPDEHKGADVLSTDEKKDGFLSEPAVDAPLDEPKEDIPEYFAPVKKSKKDKKKKRQASPWEDEVPQGTAPEPSEMASTVVEEPPSQPSVTVDEPANNPVEEGALPIDETQKDEEANREGLGQHPPVSGKSLDIEAVEATPALDDVQREATADKEVESKQALGTPLATESDTKKVAEDASPEYTSSKKSKKEKRKKRAAQLHDDLESVPVMAVEESAPIQNPRDAPLAADETVPEAVVSEEGPKELDVKNPPEEITAEGDLPVTDRLNTETELPESAVFKKSKTDKKASLEQDEREPLPSSPPTGAEPSTAQAQGHVDIPIHSEKLPNLTNKPMPEELFKEPLAEQQSVPEKQPALQEHTLPQDASVSEEPLTDPTLESTVTKDSTVPSDDLADKKGSDTIIATSQELVDQPRESVHSLGDRTTGLSKGGQPTPDQASANNLATELRVDAPTQPQVEDTMTSRLPIRVFSREVQSPASTATTDESARASHQSQKQEDAIEVTGRELQSDVPSEQPVDGAESKEDKKKGKANFKLDLERILSRQVTSRQVPAKPKEAQREVTELPATPAAAEWADHGATKKDTAILETEPASREQMPDTQHSLATQDIVANDDTAKALLPEPSTDELIPNEPTDSEGAAATSKRGRGDEKRKSSVLPETVPEPVAEHAPSDESVSLGVENDEAVSRGALTGPMMIDHPQADAPTSTELAPTQPTSTEVEMANPTPVTPERATSQHRQVSGPVDVDLSPAQLSSHIDHEPPFDQSTQPGKKVRMQSFLDDAVIPEPISATPEPTPEPVREPTPEPMPEPTPEPTPSHLEHPTPEAEASSPSKTVLDDNTQRREVPQSDSMAREFAALYFDQPASGEKSRSRPRRAPRGQDMPNLDMKHNALPILTPQRDLAVSYFEKGPSNRHKSTQGDRDTSTEDAQRGTDEAEALLAASALAGGVEKMTEQFGSSKKTKTKDKKKSENTGRGTSQEEDMHTPNTITANTEDKTDNRSATSLLKLVEDATSDSPESPIVGRGQKPGSATDRSFLSKESMQESKDLQDSQNSELIRDIEELDTSEPQAQSSPGPMPSHDMADFGRRSTMSMRSLPPVEEETHEELEDDLRHESQPGQALRSPEINRDSGFMADSPNPMRHGQFEDDTQRDSGVHLRDWADNSFTRRREGLSTLDEGARLSWASTDSRGTPKSEERRPKKSPLGDDAPRLSQYSVRSGSRSPPSDKSDTLDPRKPRTPGPVQRTPSPEYQQRSVSDNVRHFEGTARAEPEAPPQVRRSVSNTSVSRGRAPRTPEPPKLRPESPGMRSLHSSGANTPPLRRVERMSGDLRSLGQHGSHSSLHSLASRGGKSEPDLTTAHNSSTHGSNKNAAAAAATDRHRAAQTTTPVANEGRVRASRDMAEISYDGMGEGRIGSPRSPTRPHSMRRRQSMQVLELESRVEQLIAENRALVEARLHAESHGNQRAAVTVTERDAEIEQLKGALDGLRREVQRLTEVNTGLNSANQQLAVQHNDRYSRLESQHSSAAQELEQVRGQYDQTLREKDAEIQNLLEQLEATKQQVRQLQQQILATKPADADFLRLKDEDHFDHRCQQLCAHVQQWVLRFSKFSDMRACRLTSEINDEKIIDRLDNSMLDGTDVDEYLSDRVRRRDVFMSMTMNMIWEFVFTRYLFGMDREQRQKLKSLEKLLSDVGPPQAVRQWRAVTLTLLSKRPAFGNQRNEDTEAVVQAILQTLSMILPPPSNLEDQIQSQLRRVMREAVDLSIEMRTQRAEYMMLPPLQPQYDASGDIAETVTFNAALMNERSGSSTSNEEFEAQGALIRSVLFPLVVKKGNDNGVGEDEIVIFPAQVLVAKPRQPASRMVTPSSENGGVPLSRGTTPLSRKTTPSVIAKSVASIPLSPRRSPAGSR